MSIVNEVQAYGKSYSGRMETALRAKIYEANLKRIEAHNAKVCLPGTSRRFRARARVTLRRTSPTGWA
jgi:hypothetical protein